MCQSGAKTSVKSVYGAFDGKKTFRWLQRWEFELLHHFLQSNYYYVKGLFPGYADIYMYVVGAITVCTIHSHFS